MNVNERILFELRQLAKKHDIEKIILFGSRARGDNRERSDIDIAVSGGNFTDFYFEAEENVHTLLMFDIIDLDGNISDELQKEIKRDGVLIYEKNR